MSDPREYEALIRSVVENPRFVPREWLASEILSSLADPSTTFHLLTAESGVGKTGLCAALAHAHPDWLCYFIRRDSQAPLSSGDAVSFLFSIGNQLAIRRPYLFRPDKLEIIIRQRIDEVKPGARITGLAVDDLYVSPFYRTAVEVEQTAGIAGGDLAAVVVKRMIAEKRFLELDTLQHVALLDPAEVLRREDPSARIVILVDALDEIRPAADRRSLLDWLASCPPLPANVRFVLTSRNDADLRVFRGAKAAVLHEMTIDPSRDEVLADLEDYLRRFTAEPQAGRALARGAVEPAEFIRNARRRAGGNFGYVSTLTRGILQAEARGEAGLVAELVRLKRVPEQLGNLYAFFLSLLRDRIGGLGMLEVSRPANSADVGVPAWEGVAQRALGVLSVAHEALTLEQITRLGGIRAWPRDVGNVLGQMLEFFAEGEGRYRLFHASFAEYLTAPATGQAAPDYWFEPLEWHTRIVSAYRSGASDWSAVDWATVDDYGLMHLADHLAAGDAAMRRELSGLVQPAARTAMLNRFLTDAAFLRMVNLATAEALAGDNVTEALHTLVHLASVKALLTESADRIPPAVLGLMARLGRTAITLGYIDSMNAIPARYYGLRAIWANAPAADLARAGELISLDRLEDYAFELPLTSYRFAPTSQRVEALLDLVQLIAPVSLDRALILASRLPKPKEQALARDRAFRSAALSQDDPAKALALIQSLETDQSSTALDCMERLLSSAGEHCRPLLEEAERRLNLATLTPTSAEEAGRLIRAWDAIDPSHAAQLWAALLPAIRKPATGRKCLIKADRNKHLGALINLAHYLWRFGPEILGRSLKAALSLRHKTPDEEALLSAAQVYAENGEPAAARALVDRSLAVSRTHAPHATARYLAHAAKVMHSSTPAFAQSLLSEAFTLLERNPNPIFDEPTYVMIVDTVIDWDTDAALRAARSITCLGWVRMPGSIYGADRTSALARIALRQLPSNPAMASSLLDECLAALASTGVIHGVEQATSSGLDLDTPDLKAMPPNKAVMHVTYYFNALNAGMARRRWRVFDTPIEMLDDLLAPPRLNGSPYYLARTLRRFVEAAAREAPDVASQLCNAIPNQVEQGIGYAAIFDALAREDWEKARRFAGAALQVAQRLNSAAANDLNDEIEILRWTSCPVRNLMEIAMHLGRCYPSGMQQIQARLNSKVMGLYLAYEMIGRTIEEEAEGRLRQGRPLQEAIQFQVNALRVPIIPGDPLPYGVMAGHVLRILARYDLEQARTWVARFPANTLGALVRIRAASGIASAEPTQARAWLCEAGEGLDADTTVPHRVSVLGRAAAGMAALDPDRAREWAVQAVEIMRTISNLLVRGYAVLDLLRQPELHPLLELSALLREVEDCLSGVESTDSQAEFAMRAFPVFLALAPQRALRLFWAVGSADWVTLLALLDRGAEAIARACGPKSFPSLAESLEAALAYLPGKPTESSHRSAVRR